MVNNAVGKDVKRHEALIIGTNSDDDRDVSHHIIQNPLFFELIPIVGCGLTIQLDANNPRLFFP